MAGGHDSEGRGDGGFPDPALAGDNEEPAVEYGVQRHGLMIPPRSYRAFLSHCLMPGLLSALVLLSLAVPARSSTRSQGFGAAGGTVDYFELSGVIDPVSARALTRVIS